MAIVRADPYDNCNFVVDLGTGEATGFAEVTLPEGSVDVIEYREGGDPRVRKLAGLRKYSNLKLKRGLIGATDLYEWWNQVRNGSGAARRTVRIQLLNEDRSQVVFTWRLHNAWPTRYKFSDLQAQGTEVLLEILELTFDDFDVE